MSKIEEQNITHLGITAAELEQVVMGTAQSLENTSVKTQIDEVILRSKNMPPKKSVMQVLSVCEDILCQPIENLTSQDKEVLLGTLAQYTIMKRRYAEQERAAKTKKKAVPER
ncbi:MAG: hypothetical protein LBL82_01705 [Oscillospiraceae bacterium]|nr:hypothetical protein [Oscillospiraceae bacterium]